jgi:hypothetical protein
MCYHLCTQNCAFIGLIIEGFSAMQFFGIRELRENIGAYAAEAELGSISVISRNGSPLTVNIPFDERLLMLGVHKMLAARLYQEGILTLTKAAKFAQLPVDEFIAVLGSAGITVMGYDTSDLSKELDQF